MPAAKRDFPVIKVHQLLEPGPVTLVTSAHKDERNVMTMSWHTVMEFTPSLVGCVISSGNHSFDLIRESGECVINIPPAAMVDAVCGIGNCSGAQVDKFGKFNLATTKAAKVKAPLLADCFANLECKVHDDRLADDYNFFILKVVKAHRAPANPQTLHYHGRGVFSTDGGRLNRRRLLTRWKDSETF